MKEGSVAIRVQRVSQIHDEKHETFRSFEFVLRRNLGVDGSISF